MKIKEVKVALSTFLQSMSVVSGYSQDYKASHIYGTFSQKVISLKSDADYPKLFICTDAGEDTNLPGNAQEETISFDLIYIDKELPKGNDLAEKLDDFVDDIRRLITLNDTLGNTVVDVTMIGFRTDTGYLFPEGAAVVALSMQRQIRGIE